MPIVQLPSDPRKRARRERAKRLLLARGQVTEDTDVLREDVLARADDRDRRLLEVLVAPLRVRALARHRVLLELREHVPDLQALLQVVVLVRVDQLQVLPAVEDDRVVLVVRLAVAQNRVPRQLDAELGAPAARLGDELGVAVDERGEQTRVAALLARGLLLEVRDLQVRVRAQQKLSILLLLAVELGVALHRDDELELAAGHALQLPLELIGVPAEELDDLGVLDAVQELDRLRIVHHARDRAVKRLRTKRSPDTRAERELRCGGLEPDAVERQVVRLGLALLVHAEGVRAVVHLRLLGQDLGVLHEVVPFHGVQLLEVLEQRHTRVLVLLANDFPER